MLNTGKVSAEVTDRKRQFFVSNYGPVSRYSIKSDFLTLYSYVATFTLPNGVSGAPLWSKIKYQWTFKQTPVKKFGALRRNSFKEIILAVVYSPRSP